MKAATALPRCCCTRRRTRAEGPQVRTALLPRSVALASLAKAPWSRVLLSGSFRKLKRFPTCSSFLPLWRAGLANSREVRDHFNNALQKRALGARFCNANSEEQRSAVPKSMKSSGWISGQTLRGACWACGRTPAVLGSSGPRVSTDPLPGTRGTNPARAGAAFSLPLVLPASVVRSPLVVALLEKSRERFSHVSMNPVSWFNGLFCTAGGAEAGLGACTETPLPWLCGIWVCFCGGQGLLSLGEGPLQPQVRRVGAPLQLPGSRWESPPETRPTSVP